MTGARPIRAEARKRLRDSWPAETGADAHEACDLFIWTFGATYPGAAEWLIKGRDAVLTFHDVPAPHWQSMRRSHPIESAIATIRHHPPPDQRNQGWPAADDGQARTLR